MGLAENKYFRRMSLESRVYRAAFVREIAPGIVIHSEELLAEYTAVLFNLTAKPEKTSDEDDAIALLTLLIKHYERERE